MKSNKVISAGEFWASFSSAGRELAQNTTAADQSQPKRIVVERWDGEKFIEVPLEWNGFEYREVE